MPWGFVCPEARVVGVPPAKGTFITVPPVGSVQYTLAASTAMPWGFPPEARVVGVPPAKGTFITVPPVGSVQYTLVASTAMPWGFVCPEARVTRHSPELQAVAHTTPHPPQLFESVCSSTHAPEQHDVPLEQPLQVVGAPGWQISQALLGFAAPVS
jgi:hypothetical protein